MAEAAEPDKAGEEITVLPEDQKRAVELFGMTESPKEAGFILSDGRLLVSRGDSEHNKVAAAVYPGADEEDALEQFIYGGAIRFRYAVGRAFAEFKVPPTQLQIATLVNVTYGIEELHIECTVPDKHRGRIAVDGVVLDERLKIPDNRTVRKFISRANEAISLDSLKNVS